MSIVIRKPENSKPGNDQNKVYGVYNKSVLDTKVTLFVTEIGKNIKTNLESKIVSKIGGKCITEGYIKPGSIHIINYSSGSVNGDIIEYHVLFECMICLPVEGMLIECISRTITKAGIHAQVIDDDGNMPVTVFVARDHHHIDDRFLSVKENTKLTVRVIGIRYELNDKCICAIANLTDTASENVVKIKKQK
jgi:DNA-directed RNA polymerase subunit E'/Rpb7